MSKTVKDSLMKKAKLPVIAALSAIIVLGAAGCSLIGNTITLTVKNESSSALTVSVRIYHYEKDYETWKGNLPAGKSKTINAYVGRASTVTGISWVFSSEVTYTVNGKTGIKTMDELYNNSDVIETITQADVDNLR